MKRTNKLILRITQPIRLLVEVVSRMFLFLLWSIARDTLIIAQYQISIIICCSSLVLPLFISQISSFCCLDLFRFEIKEDLILRSVYPGSVQSMFIIIWLQLLFSSVSLIWRLEQILPGQVQLLQVLIRQRLEQLSVTISSSHSSLLILVQVQQREIESL